jgi:hypothetical protein
MGEPGAMSNPIQLESVHIRMLIPLRLEETPLLEEVRHSQTHGPGPAGERPPIIAADGPRFVPVQKPHRSYAEDVYDYVSDFFFKGSRQGAFGVWQVEPRICGEWFNRVEMTLKNGGSEGGLEGADRPVAVRLAHDSGIELFLSPRGIGLLSIALRIDAPPGLRWTRGLAHRLSTRQRPVWFERHAHPVDLSKVPSEQLAAVTLRPALAADAPLAERLVRGGGAYAWKELRAYLLAPLKATLGAAESYPRDWCDTILYLQAGADLKDRAFRRIIKDELSALAQVHPAQHPGEFTTERHVAFFLVNVAHIAAVGLAGAAHAVTPTVQPYDPAHQLRVQNTYFVPYLIASLQRLMLQKHLTEAQDVLVQLQQAIEEESGEPTGKTTRSRPVAQSPPKEPSENVKKLLGQFDQVRNDVLMFGLFGELLEISQRGTLQAYYRVARQASDVPRALEQLRAVIAERDRIHRAEKLNQNVEALKELQGKVEWLEVAIFSIYLVELAQIMGEASGFAHNLWNGTSLAVLGGLTLFFAWMGLQPQKHVRLSWRMKAATVGMVLALLAYVGFNLHRQGYRVSSLWNWFRPAAAAPATPAPPPARPE